MLTLKTAPKSEPVDAILYKQYLRLSTEEMADDAMLASLAKAARLLAEQNYNGAFVTQTWLAYFDDWNELAIWKQPVASITSVKYHAGAGTTLTTWAATEYDTDLTSFPARITPKPGASFPTTDGRINGIVVEFVAGWALADVPENAKMGLLQIMRSIYDNPGDHSSMAVNYLPFASRHLLESVFKPGY